MEGVKELISSCINAAVKNNETTKCRFSISVPNIKQEESLEVPKSKAMLELLEIFKRNGVSYNSCDNVLGSFNLNREFLETSIMDCAVEWTGAYPVNWDIDDVIRLEEMENTGEIIIIVSCYNEDGTYAGLNS